MDPVAMSLRSRLAGLTTASRNDMAAIGRSSVTTRLQRFADEIDPEGKLSEGERMKRAQLRLRAQKRGRARAANVVPITQMARRLG